MAPEEACIGRRFPQEGSFPAWPYYVLCTGNTSPGGTSLALREVRVCKRGTRWGHVPPFPFGAYRQLLCVAGGTGNGCQLSATRMPATRTRVRILRANPRRRAPVWSLVKNGFLSGMRTQCVHQGRSGCINRVSIDGSICARAYNLATQRSSDCINRAWNIEETIELCPWSSAWRACFAELEEGRIMLFF